jgi:DNA-binding transcriptional LysR family regulator
MPMFLRKEANDFLVVSQFLNFTKAADYLGVQQSGLSKNIKKIESELKKPLFIRKARGLELTEVGRIYKKYLIDIDSYKEQFDHEVNALSNEVVGQFSIGAHPVLAKFVLPKLKAALKDYPSLQLDFDFSTSRECTEKVLQNELDLAIVASPINYPDLIVKNLWKEYIGLYSTDGLLKQEILYNNKMQGIQKFLSQYPQIKPQRVDDYDILYSILKRTDSMGFLPHPIAEKEGKLKRIRALKPGVNICLIYRSDRFSGKAFKVLTQQIKNLNFITTH